MKREGIQIVATNLALLLPLVAVVGCGTIRGTPPAFDQRPSAMGLHVAPTPPAQLPDSNLKKQLAFPPQATTLTALTAPPSDPNTIFYPGLRLLREDELVNTSPTGKGDLLGSSELPFSTNSFLAILDLKNESAQAAASGRLAADFLYRAVRRLGRFKHWNIKVVDRSNAFKSMREEKTSIGTNDVSLSESELFQMASRYQYATYWISGAVTSFSLENKELLFGYTIETNSLAGFVHAIDGWRGEYADYLAQYKNAYLPAFIRYREAFAQRQQAIDTEYENYSQRYQAYLDAYENDYTKRYWKYVSRLRTAASLSNLLFLPLHLGLEIISFGNADTWTKAEPLPQKAMVPLTPKPSLGPPAQQVAPLDLRNSIPARCDVPGILSVYQANNKLPNPISRMATVCNVGLTLRLVDGRTSDIIWIGNGSVRNTDLQIGTQALCDKLIDEMMSSISLIPVENHRAAPMKE